MGCEYKINQIIHGFRIISVLDDDELHSRIFRMTHEKTGADLFWMDNGNENMVFSIAFRTLPNDSTGVFHILEHSVLCGSRNYQVKEPFVELLKSSMNTFLNAMTFPDMTMFPVSSRNFRDLMNLTGVYLDAVFHPTVLTDRKRFCQEGWHISRNDAGFPEFRGIVYNEMKGSMSDPDTLMDRQIMRQLFPDTSYGYNSGGDPEHITDLTWEAFKKSYRKCYHPSNSYIYLDGAIDPDIMLAAIDCSFSGFSRRSKRPVFRYQEPRPSEETIFYEISPEESLLNRSHLTIARITGTWQDRAANLARSIVCEILTGSNESPLKHAALEKEICQDLNLSVDDTGLQSWICVHADNVSDGKESEIIGLLEKMGQDILRNGIRKDAAEASLNRLIFSLREDEEPQGISRCIRSMGTWLYGGDPAEALRTQDMIHHLRSMIADGSMDKLAADMLLNHENLAILHTVPSHRAGWDKQKEEEQRIFRIMDSWSDQEKEDHERLIRDIREWQETPDSEEHLKRLPVLTRAEADITPEWIETEEKDIDGTRILYHRIPCNGIVYIRAYFPLTGFTLNELTMASLFSGMLGRLPTKRHDAFSLQQEIKRETGSLGFAVMTRSKNTDDHSCTPYLTAFVSALEEKEESACRLLAEILTETLIDGQEERIRDIMLQNEISARQRLTTSGHLIAVKTVLSRYSADAAVKNALDGEPAIRYIHRFSLFPDQETHGFIHTAQKLLSHGINKAGLVISVTGTCNPNLRLITEALQYKNTEAVPLHYSVGYPSKIGYRIPAQVGFSARGYRLSCCGENFSGIVWLTCSILSLEYLWNRVRIRGGSYGAGFQTDRNGNIFSYSYRDPTPDKTLAADFGASAFIRDFIKKEDNLDKYIISSLNELNPMLSPREKGALADARIMTGITREETEHIRWEILNAEAKDLVSCGEWLDHFAAEGSICIAAPQSILKNHRDFEIIQI